MNLLLIITTMIGPWPMIASAGVALWTILGLARPEAAHAARWYTPEQARHGAEVYAPNRANCHGPNAEATPAGRTLDSDGKFPPPPLNGSAHAGLERNATAAPVLRVSGSTGAAPDPVTEKLQRLLPGSEIGVPEPTPLPGIYQVRVDGRYAYVSTDGHYALMGDLMDLEQGTNLTDASRKRDVRALLDAFPEQDMVIYPAQDQQRAAITVFSDTSCPYCRRLHRELPALLQAGVAVHYIAFPRAGTEGNAYQTMRAVWCAEDRQAAMDTAQGVGIEDLGSGDCAAAAAVEAGFRLGQRLGVRGTPTIVLPDGSIQSGYLPAASLLARLGIGAHDARPSNSETND